MELSEGSVHDPRRSVINYRKLILRHVRLLVKTSCVRYPLAGGHEENRVMGVLSVIFDFFIVEEFGFNYCHKIQSNPRHLCMLYASDTYYIVPSTVVRVLHM